MEANEFDMHVGQINALYRDIYSNVSGYDIDDTLKYRTRLVDAMVAISDALNLWIPLEQFIGQHPEVIYTANTGMPIRLGQNTLPLETWLIGHDKFTTIERHRCYDWGLNHILAPDDPFYAMYLHLLLNRSSVYQIQSLLTYQNNHFFNRNREAFDLILSEILAQELEVGLKPLQPAVVGAVKRWQADPGGRNVPQSKKGRRPKNLGGGRQKETGIIMSMIVDNLDYKCTGEEAAEAFSIMTGYASDGLQRVLSALRAGNDSNFQFNKDDFEQARQLLEKMLIGLPALRDKMTKNTKR